MFFFYFFFFVLFQKGTVLHCAANRGHLNIVKYLVEDCKMDVNTVEKVSYCQIMLLQLFFLFLSLNVV